MALLGNKPPAMIWRGNMYEFPTPLKGDGKSPYKPLGKTYENIDGERIKGSQSWRWEKEYAFVNLPSGLYDNLAAIINKSAEVIWLPHGDIPFVRYAVHIEDLSPSSVGGNIQIDKVEFKTVGVRPVNKIPSIDNMIGGFFFFRIGVM